MNGPQMQFIGRLTQDPRLQYSRNNAVPFVTVPIAVHTYRGPDNDDETIFVDTIFWRAMAENVANRCRRGHEVLVQGRYRFRTYVKRDGSTGYAHDLTATDFTHLLQSPSLEQRAQNIADQATRSNSGAADSQQDPALPEYTNEPYPADPGQESPDQENPDQENPGQQNPNQADLPY